MRWFIQILLSCSLMVSGNAVLSDEQKPSGDAEVEKVILAGGLAELGEKEKDPLALASAAKIYIGLGSHVLEKGQTGKDGKRIDPYALLDTARDFANKDEHVLAVIDQVEDSSGGGGSKQIYCPYPLSAYYEWYCSYGNCWYRWVCY